MSGFTQATHIEVGEDIYLHLAKLFPEFSWIVLPELDASKGIIGFYINARKEGHEINVCNRPMVKINRALDMMKPEFLRDIVGSFLYTFFENKMIEPRVGSSFVLSDGAACPTHAKA